MRHLTDIKPFERSINDDTKTRIFKFTAIVAEPILAKRTITSNIMAGPGVRVPLEMLLPTGTEVECAFIERRREGRCETSFVATRNDNGAIHEFYFRTNLDIDMMAACLDIKNYDVANKEA